MGVTTIKVRCCGMSVSLINAAQSSELINGIACSSASKTFAFRTDTLPISSRYQFIDIEVLQTLRTERKLLDVVHNFLLVC